MIVNYKFIFFALLVSSLAVPPTAGMSHAETDNEEKYSKNYINRMFTELEPVMVFDENMHLSLNHTAAEYYGLSPYDTRFGEEYIAVHNNLMDTMAAGGNVTEALLPITEGRFSAVFDETKRAKRGYFDSTACGGHNMANPHKSYRYNVQTTDTVKEMKQDIPRGYQVILGSLLPNNDPSYQKISQSISSCDDGQFRDQITLYPQRYAWQPDEPNPNINQYITSIPTYWWISYVAWWHNDYNNKDSNVVSCGGLIKPLPFSGTYKVVRC